MLAMREFLMNRRDQCPTVANLWQTTGMYGAHTTKQAKVQAQSLDFLAIFGGTGADERQALQDYESSALTD